jgi:membrane protease YdiL (CAAX protease family)
VPYPVPNLALPYPAQPGFKTPQAPYPAQPIPYPVFPYPAPFAYPGAVQYPFVPPRYPPIKSTDLALPIVPTDYARFFRGQSWRWWRSTLAMLLAPVGYILALVIIIFFLAIVDGAFGVDVPEELDSLDDGEPVGLLTGNLFIAGFIPICFLTTFLFIRQTPGFLSSVQGRFRWRWFAIIIGPILAVFGIWIGLVGWLPELNAGWTPQIYSQTIPMIVAILLTVPLQCAGEEYLARGLLFRGVASFFGERKYLGPVIGAIVSSAAFTAMHGQWDPWRVISLFGGAMAMCWVTWRTGGLEATIAMHIGNNFAVYTLVPFYDPSLAEVDSGPAPVWIYLTQLALDLVSLVIVELLLRRFPQARQAAPGLDRLPAPATIPMVPWASQPAMVYPGSQPYTLIGDRNGPYEYRN